MNQNQTESKPPNVEEPRKEGVDETACCRLSDTPETDSLLVPPAHTRVEAILAVQTVAEHARKLERQRDALVDALRPFTTLNPESPRVRRFWDGFVTAARDVLGQIRSDNADVEAPKPKR